MNKRIHHDLIIAWAKGAKIEFLSSKENWVETTPPCWDASTEYRVKQTKPSINWSQVVPSIIAMATDVDGATHLFITEPVKHSSGYWLSSEISKRAEVVATFAKGSCRWEESLVLRPTPL